MSEYTHRLGSNPATGAIPQKTMDWIEGQLEGPDLTGLVTSVNGEEPDGGGNVTIQTGVVLGVIDEGDTPPGPGVWAVRPA